MRNSQLKKYYDLPKLVFFVLYIANAILALIGIATSWIGYSKFLPELTMTFNAFVLCVSLALVFMSIINSDKKIRINGFIYSGLVLLLVIGWILLAPKNDKSRLAGEIINTIDFVLIAGFSIFLSIMQNAKKKTIQQKFKQEEQPKVEDEKVESKSIEKLDAKVSDKHEEKPKIIEQKNNEEVKVESKQIEKSTVDSKTAQVELLDELMVNLKKEPKTEDHVSKQSKSESIQIQEQTNGFILVDSKSSKLEDDVNIVNVTLD